jgi:hypothetical protein
MRLVTGTLVFAALAFATTACDSKKEKKAAPAADATKNPGEKPVAKPGETPVVKPGEKPDEKPALPPAEGGDILGDMSGFIKPSELKKPAGLDESSAEDLGYAINSQGYFFHEQPSEDSASEGGEGGSDGSRALAGRSDARADPRRHESR